MDFFFRRSSTPPALQSLWKYTISPAAICPPAKIIFTSDHFIFVGGTTTCLQKHSRWSKKKILRRHHPYPTLPSWPIPLQPNLGLGFGEGEEGGEGRAAALPPSVESRRKGREGSRADTLSPLAGYGREGGEGSRPLPLPLASTCRPDLGRRERGRGDLGVRGASPPLPTPSLPSSGQI